MGENKKESRLKSAAKTFVKKKAKQAGKKLLKRIMFPWGVAIIAVVLAVLLLLSTIIGNMGDNTIDDKQAKQNNESLDYYTVQSLKQANGSMDDYFNIAKNLALTKGHVISYMKLEEIHKAKDASQFGTGNTDVIRDESVIDETVNKLKPDFTYKTEELKMTRKYKVFKKGSIPGVVAYSSMPSNFEAINYPFGTNIYIKSNNTTYTAMVANFTSVSGPPPQLKRYDIIDTLPDKFNANHYSSGKDFYVVSENQAYSIADQTDTSTNKIKLLTHAVTIAGTFNITYNMKTVKYTRNINDPDKDGEYTVTEPELTGHTMEGKPYDPLKRIIKNDFPDEDIALATDMVVNCGSDYNNKAQNGNWINEPVDEYDIDNLLFGSNGDFSGLIPLYLQYDERWGSYPYARVNIAHDGCGPTALAMVVTGLEGNLGSWDKNGDGLFTPDEAASFSTANGCIDGDYNTSWDLFSKAASTFGLTCREITDSGTMLAELKAGHPVIASMGPGHFTKGGHFIVLVSVDSSGKITVNDPNSPDQKADVYDSNIVTSEAVHYWAFNNPNLNFNYKATAYDLSYDSNQKNPGDSDYGLTANGTNLVGKSIKDKARYIAVDPSLIPLGSTVYVIFPSNERFITLLDGTKVDLNGVYIAADTGGAIKGEHIDVFLGDKLNNIYPQWNNPYVHIRIIHKGS